MVENGLTRKEITKSFGIDIKNICNAYKGLEQGAKQKKKKKFLAT
jgi:hypothetical protein